MVPYFCVRSYSPLPGLQPLGTELSLQLYLVNYGLPLTWNDRPPHSRVILGNQYSGGLMLTLTTLTISVLDNRQRHNDLHKLDLTETRWHKLAYSQLSLRCPTTVKTPIALNVILLPTTEGPLAVLQSARDHPCTSQSSSLA
jgi:hypothetical protein